MLTFVDFKFFRRFVSKWYRFDVKG